MMMSSTRMRVSETLLRAVAATAPSTAAAASAIAVAPGR